MMILLRALLLGWCCFAISYDGYAWNALGHRLIAEIAYDELSPSAKTLFNRYNEALDRVYPPASWDDAAVWLDTLRYQDIAWFSSLHYIDQPFSIDDTPLPIVQDRNAVWAIASAMQVLRNKYAKPFDKGLALRILLHVVGDIHQPLHAATRVSREHPLGDRGGNLVLLKDRAVAHNLHAYWDRGAGLLRTKKRLSSSQIKDMAFDIHQRWPCTKESSKEDQWAAESYALAVAHVYRRPINRTYQRRSEKISEQRIAQAGCRLGNLLMSLSRNVNH